MTATTYKFLARGAKGPFSGFAWPCPREGAAGAWVQTEGSLLLCRNGVHVCRAQDLAHWLHDELWETERDGDELPGLDCVVVRRARLVRRIEAWDEDGGARFGEACIAHAAALAGAAPSGAVTAFLEDARLVTSAGYIAVGAFSAALAVARLEPAEEESAFRRERLWQAHWIATELIGVGR
jgi:hypothetical protein